MNDNFSLYNDRMLIPPVPQEHPQGGEAAASVPRSDFAVPVVVAINAVNVDTSTVGSEGASLEAEEEVLVESRGFAGRENRPRAASTSTTTTSDGKLRIQEDDENRGPPHKRKRNRTTEMHNMTERKRRDNIKRKLKALQEIIPNSHKLDKASLLDETIAYVKALQLQIQIMQASGMCHSPPGAMHCLHMPHFSPFSHMGMGYGMGMTGMSRSFHSPIMSMPSPMMATNMVPMPAGFSSIPAYCPLSQPMPSISLPEYSPTGLPPIPSPPVLRPGPFSSDRGEASSQEAALNQLNVPGPNSSTC